MTSQELKAKLEASQEKVEKRIDTIAKVCKGLKVNHNDLLEEYRKVVVGKITLTRVDANAIVEKFVEKKPTRDANGHWDDNAYEFNWKVDQLRDNLDKLFDIEDICKNWETKYLTQLNKEEAPKIKVLWDFLTRWENNAREWYLKNSDLYIKLYENEDVEWEAYKDTKDYELEVEKYIKWHPKYPRNSQEYRAECEWKKRYYEDINQFTKDITEIRWDYQTQAYSYNVDLEKLNKYLAQEKINKYEDLCNRISAVVGEILDVSNLSIGEKQGELNGIVIGSKAKAKVETISAGGWNIQCFHYRVLVNKVKA